MRDLLYASAVALVAVVAVPVGAAQTKCVASSDAPTIARPGITEPTRERSWAVLSPSRTVSARLTEEGAASPPDVETEETASAEPRGG